MPARDKVFVGAIALITVLEVLSRVPGGMFTRTMAAYVWVSVGVLYLANSLWLICRRLGWDLRTRNLVGIFSLVWTICFFGWGVAQRAVNFEAALQVRDALLHLGDQDLGYTGIGYRVYPLRQLTIAAIPSAIFGSSSWALYLGFELPFSLGILLFYSAMGEILGKSREAAWLAAIGVLALTGFNYLLSSHQDFHDQTVYAYAFALQAFAHYFFFLRRRTFINGLSLFWVMCFLSTTYPSALAAWALAVFALALRSLEETRWKGWRGVNSVDLALAGAVFTFGITNVLCVPRVMQPDGQELDLAGVIKNSIQGMEIFLTQTPAQFFQKPLLFVPIFVVASVFTGLFLRPTKYFIISVWSLATVALAVTFGASANVPAVQIHRAALIAPIVTAFCLQWALYCRCRILMVRYAAYGCLFVALVYNSFVDFRHRHMDSRSTDWNAELSADANRFLTSQKLNRDTKTEFVFVTRHFTNIYDVIPYFYLNSRTNIFPSPAQPGNDRCFLIEAHDRNAKVVVYQEEGLCVEVDPGLRLVLQTQTSIGDGRKSVLFKTSIFTDAKPEINGAPGV